MKVWPLTDKPRILDKKVTLKLKQNLKKENVAENQSVLLFLDDDYGIF